MNINHIKIPLNITNFSDIGNEDEFKYILTKEELQYMLNGISSDLKHPVTVMNLNYNNNTFLPNKENEEEYYRSIRIDSVSSFYALRNTCRNLRIAAGEFYCLKCDYHHAEYCKNVFLNNEYTRDSCPFFSKKYTSPKIRESNNKISKYMIYDCPMLGYSEICFPIYFGKKIIGILFVGEILLDEKKERIKEIKKDFLDNHFDIFSKYCKDINQKYNVDISEKIKQHLMKELSNKKVLLEDINASNEDLVAINFQDSINEEKLQVLIDECAKHVKKLENKFSELWKEKQKKYIDVMLKNIGTNYYSNYKKIKSKKDITYDEIQNLFEVLYKSIALLRKEFSFDYCRVFENLPLMQGNEFEMNIEDEIGFCPYIDLKYDFSKVELNISTYKSSVKEIDDNPIKYFTYSTMNSENNLNCSKTDVALACENFVVLFGINEICKINSYFSIPDFINILFDEIGTFFLNMCTAFENISAIFMQQKHQKTLRMYRHECAHLAQRIQQNNLYYHDRYFYERLSDEKKKNIFKDIDSVAILLQNLSENIGLIVGSINENNLQQKYELIDIRNEINKWRAMFRLELQKKNIRLYNSTDKKYGGKYVYSHEELMCLLLYNLIDNAVKYSYWGTNINANITEGNIGSRIIIEDYGSEIENNNHPYDLYYRQKSTSKKEIGDGIGLYSSRKVAELLNLKLYHTCEKISNFNLPLVKEAKRRKICFNNMEEAFEELDRVEERVLIQDDYYLNKKELSVDRILDDIYKPIYHVVFTIDGFDFSVMKG